MSNPDATRLDDAELLEEQRQWGEKKIIDGAMCRQCRRCLRWFHIGWTAYHGCAANRPVRALRSALAALPSAFVSLQRLIRFEVSNTLLLMNTSTPLDAVHRRRHRAVSRQADVLPQLAQHCPLQHREALAAPSPAGRTGRRADAALAGEPSLRRGPCGPLRDRGARGPAPALPPEHHRGHRDAHRRRPCCGTSAAARSASFPPTAIAVSPPKPNGSAFPPRKSSCARSTAACRSSGSKVTDAGPSTRSTAKELS